MSALDDTLKRFRMQQASIAERNLKQVAAKPVAAKRKPPPKKPAPPGEDSPLNPVVSTAPHS